MGFQPVVSAAAFHRERNRQRNYVLHNLFHQFLQLRYLRGGGFEQQFVVNLQHHAALKALLLQLFRHADHGQFDDIGRCALDGGVHGIALCQGTDGGVAGADVRQVAAAAEEGFHKSVFPGEGDAVVNEAADGRESLEVTVYQFLGGASAQVQPLGQAEGGDAVHDAEIGRLGHAALLPCHFFHRDAEYLGGGGGVHVHPVPKSLRKVGVAAQVGHDAKLYLGIVRAYDEPVRNARNEGLANFFSPLCAHRDVLQVGIGTGQAAGGRKGLVERSVHTAVLLGDIRRKGLYVSGKQLFHGAEFQNLVHDGMPVRNGHQRGFVRGVLRLVPALFGLGVQFQFVKKEVSHLSGGGNVQRRFIGHFPDAGLPFRQLFAKAVGKFLQAGQVHLHAVPLHLGKHLGQRLFHGLIKVRQVFPELVPQGNEHGRLLETGGVLLLGNLVKKGPRSGGGR